jgi:hypothetical protein
MWAQGQMEEWIYCLRCPCNLRAPDTRDLRSLVAQGEASHIRDEYSAPRSAGTPFRQRTGQVHSLQGGPGAACQRNGQDTINVVGAHHLSEGWTGGVSSP